MDEWLENLEDPTRSTTDAEDTSSSHAEVMENRGNDRFRVIYVQLPSFPPFQAFAGD